MNRIALAVSCLALALASYVSHAQTPDTQEEIVYELADVQQKPEYPGGEMALLEYMINGKQYPDEAKAEGIRGVVLVRFNIEKDGKVTNAEAIRSPHESLSKEAVRMVMAMPAWIPARHDGQPVKLSYVLPVRFDENEAYGYVIDDGGVDDASKAVVQHEVVIVDERPKREPTYDLADVQVKPQFPGGEAALNQHIATNLRYPADAQEEGFQGTVVVQFTIDKDGATTNIKAVRSPHESLSREAIRLVESMPAWTPGSIDGQPVKVNYTLPVRFKLGK